jgi:hypothetical protein
LSNELYIKVPAGRRIVRFMDNLAKVSEAGTAILGEVMADPNLGDRIKIIKFDAANYASATNTTGVRGQITFEVD